MILTKLDEYGRPAWIAAVILGFWLFWPAGLALLAFLAFSGRLGVMRRGRGRWNNLRSEGWCSNNWAARWRTAQPSGNRAFDEYREDTLRRLEEEQKEFMEYLERLRQARDRAEFDQFMAERRPRPTTPAPREE